MAKFKLQSGKQYELCYFDPHHAICVTKCHRPPAEAYLYEEMHNRQLGHVTFTPLVSWTRIHPCSGRRCQFINPGGMTGLIGHAFSWSRTSCVFRGRYCWSKAVGCYWYSRDSNMVWIREFDALKNWVNWAAGLMTGLTNMHYMTQS